MPVELSLDAIGLAGPVQILRPQSHDRVSALLQVPRPHVDVEHREMRFLISLGTSIEKPDLWAAGFHR